MTTPLAAVPVTPVSSDATLLPTTPAPARAFVPFIPPPLRPLTIHGRRLSEKLVRLGHGPFTDPSILIDVALTHAPDLLRSGSGLRFIRQFGATSIDLSLRLIAAGGELAVQGRRYLFRICQSWIEDLNDKIESYSRTFPNASHFSAILEMRRETERVSFLNRPEVVKECLSWFTEPTIVYMWIHGYATALRVFRHHGSYEDKRRVKWIETLSELYMFTPPKRNVAPCFKMLMSRSAYRMWPYTEYVEIAVVKRSWTMFSVMKAHRVQLREDPNRSLRWTAILLASGDTVLLDRLRRYQRRLLTALAITI